MTFGDAYTYAFCIRDYVLTPGHGNSLTNLKYFFSIFVSSHNAPRHSSCLWGGALRDDTKKDCVAD